MEEQKPKTNINDYHENQCSNFLLEAHTIGKLRDKADFDNAVYHARQTITFAKDILMNIEGTNEY